MFSENNFDYKDTLVHRINPLIKFIVFLSIIFLLFLKITLFVQLILLAFVVLVALKGDCKRVLKKAIPVYIFLLLFLFTVNFFFMKSPGFWTHNTLLNFRDFTGIHVTTNRTEDIVYNGWFYGGKILKDNSGKALLVDDASCLDYVFGWSDQQCSHSAHASLTRDESSKWRVFPLHVGNKVKYVAFLPTWYMISLFQFLNAVSLANKIILIIILSSVFSITCSLPSFTYALEDLFRPLKIIKLPAEVMALAVAISVRFAPSLIHESFRIIRAQASRGIDYKNGRIKDKASALLSLFVPLFVISFLKSGELAEAMIARGYEQGQSRTSYRIHLAYFWELLVLGVTMFFISILYYLYWHSYYFGGFSYLEYMVSIAQ